MAWNFWNNAKGWGAIASEVLPPGRDAWVIGSKIERQGHRARAAGQIVEFSFPAQKYESFDYVADFVRVVTGPDGSATPVPTVAPVALVR